MRRLTASAAALTALATAGVGVGTAYAAGSGAQPAAPAAKAPATLASVQAAAAKAIALRVSDLGAALTKVRADTFLGADQSTLEGRLQTDLTGLQALDTKIKGDTTLAAARADTATIFTGYRILALALPVTRMVATTDRLVGTTLPRASARDAKLAARVTPANSTQLTPLVTDIKTQVAAATSATSGLSATLLSLTPASWNADHGVLTAPRARLKSAVADVKKAAADAKQARSDLVGSRAAAHPAG